MPYLAVTIISTAPASFSTSKRWPHTRDLTPLFSSLQLSPYLKLDFFLCGSRYTGSYGGFKEC